MKRTMRGGHRLALVSITAVLASLGTVPAFADEGPLVTVPTATVDAATTTSATVAEVDDAATTGVDQLSDAATSVVGAADSAAASTVDSVTNVASGASGTITSAASDAAGSVAASAGGNLTDAVTDVTGAGDAGSGTWSATAGSSDRTGGSSSHEGISSDSAGGASPLRSGRERSVQTLADGAEHPRWAVHDGAPCADAGGPRCSPTSGAGEEDSLAEKISEVIGLLALTGFQLLPWIAAMLALTVLGSVALERARGTGSRARRVTVA
jgi:hypothetical protein